MNKQLDFIVIDKNTGKQSDISEIALKEDWAKGLMYCDMEGFAISENGQLVLLDECGNFAYCPYDRFTIQFENSVVLSREELNKKYISVEMYELAKAFHDEKCAEFEKLCYDYHKLQDTINEKIASKIADYVAQARKETAREILERGKYCMPSGLREWIEKQYGVDLGEEQ